MSENIESKVSSLRITHPEPGIVSLALNRPTKKNALDRDLVLALGEALRQVAADPSVRVVLLTGVSGSFCSGADLSTIRNASPEELDSRIDEFHRMITGIVDAPQPVIAAVSGPAVGFGADLALACDMRLFSQSAYLEEGFIKVGLMPDGGGTGWMPKMVGPRAFEMLALGTRLSASDCQGFGIANSVHPETELITASYEVAQRLAQSAPLALRNIKRALRAGDRDGLSATLEREKRGQTELLGSSDFEEGVRAFLEKREAQFTGK